MEITKDYLIEKIKLLMKDHQQLAMTIQQNTDYLKKLTGAIEVLESLIKEMENKEE